MTPAQRTTRAIIKRHGRAFLRQLLADLATKGDSEIAAMHGLHRQQVHRWRKALGVWTPHVDVLGELSRVNAFGVPVGEP